MKKYLSLAAIMGAVAFLSVSYLAQAQTPAATAPATGAAMAPAAAAPAAPAAGSAMQAASPAAVTYAKDRAECDALASAPSTEGAAPSAADKELGIKKCLAAKGHKSDEIMKAEAAAMAPAAKTPAATAPAAPTAPAAH